MKIIMNNNNAELPNNMIKISVIVIQENVYMEKKYDFKVLLIFGYQLSC